MTLTPPTPSALADARATSVPIDPLFTQRWSPRAYDRDCLLSAADLQPLFEAARWAPSGFNWQPWRFAYALRQEPRWQDFVGLLMPFNAQWAQHASALVFVSSETQIRMPQAEALSPSHSHSFDTGAACTLLALQATRAGLHLHMMSGVDLEGIRRRLGVPETQRVEVVLAIGRRGDAAQLPEHHRAREAPNGRKPVSEFAGPARLVD